LNQQWQFVQVETTTSKKDLSKDVKSTSENETSIYVNSTRDYLKINAANSGAGEVEIYSISGQSVLKKVIYFVKGSEGEVEISRLPEGVYIVKINDGKEISTKKILK
jgi:glucosylceramidase